MLQLEAQACCQWLCSIICQAEKDFIGQSFKRKTNYVWSRNTELLIDDPDGLVYLKDGGLAITPDEVRRIIHGTEMFWILGNLRIIQSVLTYQRMTLLSPVALSPSTTGATSSKLNFFIFMARMSFWIALNSSILNLWRNLTPYLDNDSDASLILQKVPYILKHPHYPSPLRIGDLLIHFKQI